MFIYQEEDLALNNLQQLICRKTEPNNLEEFFSLYFYLFEFGKSAIVGYFMPNLVYIYIYIYNNVNK